MQQLQKDRLVNSDSEASVRRAGESDRTLLIRELLEGRHSSLRGNTDIIQQEECRYELAARREDAIALSQIVANLFELQMGK